VQLISDRRGRQDIEHGFVYYPSIARPARAGGADVQERG
jgi:hypothetical protein